MIVDPGQSTNPGCRRRHETGTMSLLSKLTRAKEVRAFNTGPVAGDAQFIAGVKRLVTVTYDHGSEDAKWYLRCTVKFWNLETGQLNQRA